MPTIKIQTTVLSKINFNKVYYHISIKSLRYPIQIYFLRKYQPNFQILEKITLRQINHFFKYVCLYCMYVCYFLFLSPKPKRKNTLKAEKWKQ